MNDERPDPDELLARVREEESRAQRGKLRIFFGYAAGVGKTYAMLAAAQAERAAGTDVVVGYVEPHGRPETEALLEGLESLPVLNVTYRGVTLREFDLDAALARRPDIILVDELAHTNAPGMRHPKRWQDVEELLAAGIDVWTTLNVQHIESLNDVIAQITGVAVRETLPDTVLERADEIELIDITPDELMERLAAGKVYIPAQAERALKNFFQKGNLVALRELSLRQAASRVQRDVEAARQERAAVAPWLTSRAAAGLRRPKSDQCADRAGHEAAGELVGRRMAGRGGRHGGRRAADRPWSKSKRRETCAWPNSLAPKRTRSSAATWPTRCSTSPARETSRRSSSAKRRSRAGSNGLSARSSISCWTRAATSMSTSCRAKATLASPLGRHSPRAVTPLERVSQGGGGCRGLRAARLGGARDAGLAEANIVMIFLAGVAFVAARLGRGPAIAAAIASVLVFDFFFVPPQLTFAVSDTEYVITFAVMLGIGLLISELTSRLQAQLRASQQQERRTAQLFRMTRQLSELSGSEFLVRTAGRQLEEIFDGEVVLFLARAGRRRFRCDLASDRPSSQQPINEVVAQWVATNGKTAGAGTDTLPNATALFVPLAGSQQIVGALGVAPKDEDRFLDPEQVRLLETCGSLIALSIERDQSVLEAHEAQLQVAGRAAAQFAAQLRVARSADAAGHDRRRGFELARTPCRTATARCCKRSSTNRGGLTRLVENLLDMARLDSGSVVLNRQWHVLEEIVGVALNAAKRELQDHEVRVDIPADFPLLNVDGFLMEQVLVNLLENASRYTPAGSEIEIAAVAKDKRAEIRVADNGPGSAARQRGKGLRQVLSRRDRRAGRPARRGLGSGDLPGDRRGARRKDHGGEPPRRRRRVRHQSSVRRNAAAHRRRGRCRIRERVTDDRNVATRAVGRRRTSDSEVSRRGAGQRAAINSTKPAPASRRCSTRRNRRPTW